MTLIDTAEIYGSEEFIGRAIAGQRDRIFLVSKVSPNHVAGNGTVSSSRRWLRFGILPRRLLRRGGASVGRTKSRYRTLSAGGISHTP
jgi:aryl-alcohol dehydrogenase-like predicted oxidoreductase